MTATNVVVVAACRGPVSTKSQPRASRGLLEFVPDPTPLMTYVRTVLMVGNCLVDAMLAVNF